MKVRPVFLMEELGSRGHEDVLVGSPLVKADRLLLFKDQEREESVCSLQASSALTERLQAECVVTVALALTHKHNTILHPALTLSSLNPSSLWLYSRFYANKWSKQSICDTNAGTYTATYKYKLHNIWICVFRFLLLKCSGVSWLAWWFSSPRVPGCPA